VQVVRALVHFATEPSVSQLGRSFSAVMLRQLLSNSSASPVWPTLPAEVQNTGAANYPPVLRLIHHEDIALTRLIAVFRAAKGTLLQAVQAETEPMVIRRLCHAVAEVATQTLSDPGWAELMPTVFSMVKSGEPGRRSSAMFLFNKIAEYCDDVRRLVGELCAAAAKREWIADDLAARVARGCFITGGWPLRRVVYPMAFHCLGRFCADRPS